MIGAGGERTVDQLDNYLIMLLNGFTTPRKVPFIYAIMTGKRTGQAVQDIHLFRMERFFGLTPTLKSEQLQTRLRHLVDAGVVIETAQGYEIKNHEENRFAKRNYKDFTYTARGILFFSAWKLAVQVTSNWKHRKEHYLPVVRDAYVQTHIKRWLASQLQSGDKLQLRQQLYAEMELLFRLFPPALSPEAIVRQFSGGEWMGLTMQQLAQEDGKSSWDVYFDWLEQIHLVVEQLEVSPERFPVLTPLLPTRSSTLTQSATKTFQFFRTLDKKTLSVEELASRRRLKESTIHDHFVELRATFEDLEVPGLPDETTIAAIKQGNYIQLKAIKEVYPQLSYYQIRLAVVSKERKGN